jgi:hypothetical protein
MLTVDELHVLRESSLAAGYWCEAMAYTPDSGRAIWLGSHPATTPRLALRWLRNRACDIADQLDAAAVRPARDWIADVREHDRALLALRRGEMYTFTIFDGDFQYVLSARPTAGVR